MFSSHSFWTSSSLDVPAGVTQEEGHTEFLIHLPAVRALSVQYNGRFLPGIANQCTTIPPSGKNPFKCNEEVLYFCSLMIPLNVLTFFSEGLDVFILW